ncbi:MAG: hypothetical protein ABJ000_17290 [Saccharospirillum sp.]|uniref:AbiU2 domain-containing protein n=1 Tax=Saccharospirillum sp. TaxID=2033801 RepID=UPI003296BFDB
MLTESLKRDYIPLKGEMYQLCLSLYSYREKLDNLGDRFPEGSRFYLLEEITAIRAISSEVIMHFCKLDEDKSKVSFHAAKKDINKLSVSDSDKKLLNEGLKDFRKSINSIKTKHRNRYIAHLTEDGYPDPFDLPNFETEFQELIREAYKVFVLIWGAEVKFGFKVGSQERFLDFNEEFLLNA